MENRFTSMIAGQLHQEHLAAMGILGRLDTALASGNRRQQAVPVFNDLVAALEGEVIPHFRFEEVALFPRLARAGEPDIGLLLGEEHGVMMPLMEDICDLVKEDSRDPLKDDDWQRLCRLGRELVERLVSHIQKEEMGLLPMVEATLDASEDENLAQDYIFSR